MRYKQLSKVVLAVALSAGCTEEFPDDGDSASPYEVAMEAAEPDIHVGEAVELMFSVSHDHEAMEVEEPELSFEQLERGDTSGEIDVEVGEVPGTYHAMHSFDLAGTYMLVFSFMAEPHMPHVEDMHCEEGHMNDQCTTEADDHGHMEEAHAEGDEHAQDEHAEEGHQAFHHEFTIDVIEVHEEGHADEN